MTNTNKRRGTAWESAIVAFLNASDWPYVERRALAGAQDKGDIAGIPGVVVEAKSAKEYRLGEWLDETAAETANAGARVGVAWFKRRGKTSPGEGYVLMNGRTFVDLLREAGW